MPVVRVNLGTKTFEAGRDVKVAAQQNGRNNGKVNVLSS